MGLTAIRGIAKARWMILLVVGLIAVIAVARLSDYQRENALTNEAFSSVTFTEDPAMLDRGAFEGMIADEHLLAQDVNSDVLGDTPGSFIPSQFAEIDLVLDQNQILFIGRGYSQEEANEIVQNMLDRYLAISSVGSGTTRIVAEMDEVTAEIAQLEQRVLERDSADPLTEEQVQIEVTRSGLQNQISSLQGAYGSLGVELLSPEPPRTVADVQSDIDRTLAEILRLEQSLLALPPAPDVVTRVDEQALVDALRLQQLQQRWQELATQLENLRGLAVASPVAAQPVTATSDSPMSNQLLALVAAMVITLMVLVGLERTRGIIWSAAEVDNETPVLAELPPRALHTFKAPTSDPWYLTVSGGRRKAAVQLLRSQLDGYKNPVVAFSGSGVYDDDTLDLASDVALAAAVSGRSVLLIDATFSGDNQRAEFGGADVTLHSILTNAPDDPQSAIADFKALLTSLPETYRDLRSLPSAAGVVDATDVMAGQRFELLLEVARENFDVVVIAGTAFGEPTSYVLAQRVDHVILVGSIGHTADRDLEAARRDFRSRRAGLMGVVLLRRRRSKVRRWMSPRLRGTLWRFLDVLSPVTNKIKRIFTKSPGETGPGMNGFQSTLGKFSVTGESLENLKPPEVEEERF